MVYIWFTLFDFFEFIYLIINYLIKIMVYMKNPSINKNTDPFSRIGAINIKNRCNLYRKTLPTTTSTCCIRVMKIKTLTIQTIAKIKLGAGKV